MAGRAIICTPTSTKLIFIRVSAKPHNMKIIQVYAPATAHDDEEIEKFYELLESTITRVPKDISSFKGTGVVQ